ncbi:MAG: replication initiation protein [Saprospiraceae bacterium]|nr:replication initiation protein [Saprospiraceae bacterium]
MAIVKSNKLIETSYKLGSREQFFVLFLLSKISQQDTEFRQYRVHYKDIARIMNFDGRRRVANKEDIFKMMNNLNTQPIRFSEGDEDVQAVWITSLRYNRKSGEYTFTFSLELKPFLLQLKEHFTLYNISNVVYLSGHSTRMYEVLKRHQFKREPVVLSIKDLKFWLRIENKYPEYYEFKRWVLEPAKQELEQYTDIRFTYVEAEKEGKKILSLEFTIYDNAPKEHPAALNLLTNIGERLQLSEPAPFTEGERKIETQKVSKAKNEKLANLTWTQHKAFDFLSEKGVNSTFVLDSILGHPKVNYEPLRGFEDLYFQIMWSFFDAKSQSKQKVGAFVNWFKAGKLTEDGLHARFMEQVLAQRKKMKETEIEERLSAKINSKAEKMSATKSQNVTQQADLFAYTEGIKIVNQEQPKDYTPMIETMNRILKRQTNPVPTFDFEDFKKQYAEQYQAALQKAKEDYKQFYAEMGNPIIDLNQYSESIEHRAKEYCRDWLKAVQDEIG